MNRRSVLVIASLAPLLAWTLVGVAGTALTASVLGQTVWGQPGGTPLPIVTTRPEFPPRQPGATISGAADFPGRS